MKILNPFQIYSWKIRSLLIIVLAIQLSMWGSIVLDLIGIQIPLVRQFIGVIYLLFIPGILILRLLELYKLDNIESLSYTIGLSIAFLMFTGFFMNHLYFYLGILNPISVISLIVTISSIILLLCILCYLKEKGYYNYYYIDTKEIFSSRFLFLLLIPFLAIFGALIVNSYQNNSLIVIFIVSIAFLICSYGFTDLIPKNLYPFAIFTIGLSLLLHNSLISNYLWGCDIQHEYYLANIVMDHSHWNPGIELNTNAMLSIVMFAPIMSKVCSINLIWVFKIIFPLLFSLLPVGMYKIFKTLTTDEMSLLSCFFFLSCFQFYTEMSALARQQISELFFILLILVMVNSHMDNLKKSILSIVFSFSIAVSHYGFSYILIMSLLFSLIFNKLIQRIDKKKTTSLNIPSSTTTQVSLEKLMGYNFNILFIIFVLSWYMYISQGSTFSIIVRIGDSIFNSLFNDFLNPEKVQGLQVMTSSAKSEMRDITKYLHLISIFFISIGLSKLIVKRRDTQSSTPYIALSFSYFLICVFGIAVPLFASQLNTSRLYHLSLLVLAIFFSIGGVSFFNIILCRKLDAFWINKSTKQTLKLLSIFLSIFFLFNSGLIYELKGEESSSVSLNHTNYPFIYNDNEVLGAKWILLTKSETAPVYSDVGGMNLFGGISPVYAPFDFFKRGSLPKNSYIFITDLNSRSSKLYVQNQFGQLEYVDIKFLTKTNKISDVYYNGYGKIGFV